MHLLAPLLRTFFKWLYHRGAWSYDLVAAVVSLGRWQGWVYSLLPRVHGQRVLEIGYGPGHLLAALSDSDRQVVGLDASPQMARLVRRRLQRVGTPSAATPGFGYAQSEPAGTLGGADIHPAPRPPSIPNRRSSSGNAATLGDANTHPAPRHPSSSSTPDFGYAQSKSPQNVAGKRASPDILIGYTQKCPFAANSFDQIVATFPTEHIFTPQALSELRRILRPGGELLILPMAWITARSLWGRAAAGLFRITGQNAPQNTDWQALFEPRFTAVGFSLQIEMLSQPGSQLLLLTARKNL